MATTAHGLTTDGLIALSNIALVELAYAWADRVFKDGGDDGDVMGDALYRCLAEIAERHMPEAAEAELRRSCRENARDPDDALDNLNAELAAIRRLQAARLIRDAFDV